MFTLLWYIPKIICHMVKVYVLVHVLNAFKKKFPPLAAMICRFGFKCDFMAFNATFSNISVISWQSVLVMEETGVPEENHRPTTSHRQTLSHNVVHFALSRIQAHNISDDRH
jgi:hypothetical protein